MVCNSNLELKIYEYKKLKFREIMTLLGEKKRNKRKRVIVMIIIIFYKLRDKELGDQNLKCSSLDFSTFQLIVVRSNFKKKLFHKLLIDKFYNIFLKYHVSNKRKFVIFRSNFVNFTFITLHK